MWVQFFLENIHFAINFFAALVFFAIFWLYWDAWRKMPLRRDFFRLSGFLLLAISFVIEASQIEAVLLPDGFNNSGVAGALMVGTRIFGYLLVLLGMILDPLPKHPNTSFGASSKALVATGLSSAMLNFLLPIGAVSVAFMYLRRATIGLERHMRLAAFGYFVLSISHLFGLAVLFRQSGNTFVNYLVSPFGIFWILENILVLVGVGILGCWVWQYLLTRVKVQLFLVFTSGALAVFIITVTLFTGLLLSNMQKSTLDQLTSDNQIMNLALDSKKAELAAYAKMLATNSQIINATKGTEISVLATISEKAVLDSKLDSLIILDTNGKVVARGEDKQKLGDSLSENFLVKQALSGKGLVSMAVEPGPVAPLVLVRAVEPIKDGNRVIGLVVGGMVIDNAFMDGVKMATGLDTAIYGNDILAASTIRSADGKSRWVGIKETNQKVIENVLGKGESMMLLKRMVNSPYLASLAPLCDFDNKNIGMVFVGKPEISILATAGQSLSYTFIVTAILIVLSVFPAYLLARHFAYQLR